MFAITNTPAYWLVFYNSQKVNKIDPTSRFNYFVDQMPDKDETCLRSQ